MISRPTTKKKMAISPSFTWRKRQRFEQQLTPTLTLTLTLTRRRTQPRSESAWPATEKGRGVLQSASQPRLVAPMLLSESEMAVARRSATLPSPRS